MRSKKGTGWIFIDDRGKGGGRGIDLHGAAAGQNGRHHPGRLLQFKGAYIAAGCGAIDAPLVSHKQHAEFIPATAGIAGVDGRATGKQRVRLRRPAVVL